MTAAASAGGAAPAFTPTPAGAAARRRVAGGAALGALAALAALAAGLLWLVSALGAPQLAAAWLAAEVAFVFLWTERLHALGLSLIHI